MTGADIIFVEDDHTVRLGVVQALELAELSVIARDSVEAALPLVRPEQTAVIVTDVRLPGCSGLDFLARVQEIDSGLPVILITGHGDIDMAVGAIRSGAYDFLEKPFTSARLVETCKRALEKRRLVLENRRLRLSLFDRPCHPIVGRSAVIAHIRTVISRLAAVPTPVMIYGPAGAGKELVARAIHQSSHARGPMLAVPCGDVGDAQAVEDAFCQLDRAGGGTVFLDGVEQLSAGAQTRLISHLEADDNGGPHRSRVLSSTTMSPVQFRHHSGIRREVLFRINLAEIELPSLEARREDIPDLAVFFAGQAAMRLGVPAPDLLPATLSRWARQEWPGNVRELSNAVERFVLNIPEPDLDSPALNASAQRLAAQMDAVERAIIEAELRRLGGNISEAAERLGVPKKTLYDKIYRLQIRNPKGQQRSAPPHQAQDHRLVRGDVE